MNITTNCAVVRTKNIGNDRCIWLLTEKCGVVRIYLKGAAGVKSKFTSSTQLFCCGEAVLFKNKDSFSLNSFSLQDSHFKLQSDLLKLSLTSYFCEALCEIAEGEENAGDYLSLLKNCFYLIENNKKNPSLVKAVFEMRTMTIAGFMPDIINCGACEKVLPESIFYDIPSGLCLCESCHKENDDGFFLPPPVVASLRHIIFSEPKKIFSFNISDEYLKILSNFCQVYFLYHVGRGFNTLEFYESIL